MRRESEIEGDCRDHAKEQGCFLLKLNPAFFVGIPDRMLIGPKRTIYFIEFKKVGKTPGKRQSFIHGLLRDLGFAVYVIDNLKDFKEVLNAELQKAR